MTSSANRSPPDSGRERSLAASQPLRWWRRTWVRLAIAFVFVMSVPLAATAVFTTQRHLSVVRSVAARAAADRANAAARRLEESLESARNDLLALAESPTLESFVVSSADDVPDTGKYWRQKLFVQLRTFLELNSAHRSVTIADESGRVLVAVERRGTTAALLDPSSTVDIASPLMQHTIALLPRQTTVMPISGDTTFTVQMAARVSSVPDENRRIIVLESSGAAMLDVLAGEPSPPRNTIVLSNRREMLWQQHQAERPDDATPMDYSVSDERRQYLTESGMLVSTAPIQLAGTMPRLEWKIVLTEPASVLHAEVAAFRNAYLTVMSVSLLFATMVGVWLARQFTRPVRELHTASSRIGAGDFDVTLDTASGDELGALAAQMTIMADRLQAAHLDFEDRLSDATEKLLHAERLATIGRTAAAVAHEINNPSGIISLYADLLTEQMSANDPHAEKLHVIRARAHEISRIVREMLEFAGNNKPKAQWCESAALINAAVESATAASEPGTAAEMNVAVRVSDDVARIFVDPHQIDRVLRNLIVNAIHASANQGSLEIRCVEHQAGVQLVVVDRGRGMSREQIEHLFEPFYTTKRFGAGTGLGMAISRELVERHGGTISVESTPNVGTTISIYLPVEHGRRK